MKGRNQKGQRVGSGELTSLWLMEESKLNKRQGLIREINNLGVPLWKKT